MHPDWLSNAYLVADEEGGAAVFVDSGADVKPLLSLIHISEPTRQAEI